MKNGDEESKTALYRFFGADDRLLYIGISKQLGRRWEAHMRLKPWWPEVHRQTSHWYPDRVAAAKAEIAAIIKEHPLYNRHHSVRMPETVALASPWTCTACGSTTQDPVEQISHMEREVTRLAPRLSPEDAARLRDEIATMARALRRLDVSLERTQALFQRTALMPRRRPNSKPNKTITPASWQETEKLLDDLDALLGDERVRLSDLPALLRQLDPAWMPYRELTGVRVREMLEARNIRVTNTGNVRRLDPADLRRARNAAA